MPNKAADVTDVVSNVIENVTTCVQMTGHGAKGSSIQDLFEVYFKSESGNYANALTIPS